MKFFISVIDTKLLERVYLECLEAVDVQHPDELVDLLVGLESLVDLVDDPVKQVGVDALSERVSGMLRLKRSFIRKLIIINFRLYTSTGLRGVT